MAFDPDAWLIKLGSKIKWLNLDNPLKKKWDYARHIAVHFLSSGLWAAVFSMAILKFGDWFWLSAPAWVAYVLYYEGWVDGHWNRLTKTCETKWDKEHGKGHYEEMNKDLVSDLITKFAGMGFYLSVPLLKTLC
jgi:hypothetical protein